MSPSFESLTKLNRSILQWSNFLCAKTVVVAHNLNTSIKAVLNLGFLMSLWGYIITMYFQVNTIRYTWKAFYCFQPGLSKVQYYFRGGKKSFIYSDAGAVNNSVELMILISRSSNNQQVEQIFSVYWFGDETQKLLHLVSAPIMSTLCRHPLSSDVGRDASHERDGADWSGTITLTLCRGLWKRHLSSRGLLWTLNVTKPIKPRLVSAVWSHRHTSLLPTCRSHQLWLSPPTANSRQRLSREQRSCLLTRSTTTDGRLLLLSLSVQPHADRYI